MGALPYKLSRREVAHKAASARWGPRRVVRLDGLSSEQRRLIEALIAAARESVPDEPDQVA